MPETEAVADAGPLIHLDEIGLADALTVFRRVVVPDAVADELKARPRGPGVRLLRQAHIHRTRASIEETAAAARLAQFRRLSRADRLALAMAQSRDAILLTDDLDLRDAAKALEIRPVGTIGLAVRAVTMKRVTVEEAVAGLDRLLEDSSLFITQRLAERAKRAILDHRGRSSQKKE